MTLKEIRRAYNWTLKDLANATGLTIAHLCWLEGGKHKPTEATKKKIEAVVGPGVDWEATYLEKKFSLT